MIERILVRKRTFGAFNFSITVVHRIFGFRWCSYWNVIACGHAIRVYHDPDLDPPNRWLRRKIEDEVRRACNPSSAF